MELTFNGISLYINGFWENVCIYRWLFERLRNVWADLRENDCKSDFWESPPSVCWRRRWVYSLELRISQKDILLPNVLDNMTVMLTFENVYRLYAVGATEYTLWNSWFLKRTPYYRILLPNGDFWVKVYRSYAVGGAECTLFDSPVCMRKCGWVMSRTYEQVTSPVHNKCEWVMSHIHDVPCVYKNVDGLKNVDVTHI